MSLRIRLLSVIALVLLGCLLGSNDEARAHANIERSSPAEDGLLGAPPRTIELWTTERVATGAGSPGIKVLDEDGSETGITVQNPRVDPDDPRHVVADVEGIGSGTYTVVWTLRSEDDGHTLNGSYAFRVAGSSRAPGAAAVEGETPRVWAIVTRWLTFLGASLAAAGLLAGRFVFGRWAEDDGARRRRSISVLLGAALALLATLAEPFLQTRFPPEGASKPSLGDAIASLPTAWWLRPASLIVALIIAAVVIGSERSRGQTLSVIGGIVALISLLGLALTSHASARETWRVIAVPSIVLHQWSVGLWVGGLAQLALAWPWGRRAVTEASGEADGGESEPKGDPLRRFSRYALVLALVGIGTGTLNAGLVLPTLKSLWSSDYGDVLIFKVAVLVPVLALATFHRLSLRRAAEQVGAGLRRTVRIEAALILVVVIGGSVLALLAPPTIARGTVELVDLAAPSGTGQRADDLLIRLQVAPGKPGDNTLTVLVADATGTPIPSDQIALVRLGLTSLNHDAAQPEVPTTLDANGNFVSQGVQLSLADWWRVDVLVRRLGVEDVTIPFFLRLPDPNLNGFESDWGDGDDDARAVYERGLAAMTSMTSVHWTQRLAGGTGTVAISDLQVQAANGDQPAASSSVSYQYAPLDQQGRVTVSKAGDDGAIVPSFEMIVVGADRWLRQPGSDWLQSEAAPVFTPSEWGQNYEGATDFQLGRMEEIDGQMTQVVSFVVPGSGANTAFFSWWVSTETGNVLQETMVARYHYMLFDYHDINQPLTITPPS